MQAFHSVAPQWLRPLMQRASGACARATSYARSPISGAVAEERQRPILTRPGLGRKGECGQRNVQNKLLGRRLIP